MQTLVCKIGDNPAESIPEGVFVKDNLFHKYIVSNETYKEIMSLSVNKWLWFKTLDVEAYEFSLADIEFFKKYGFLHFDSNNTKNLITTRKLIIISPNTEMPSL